MLDRVSVIMPAFNAAEYIAEALDSVFAQQPADFSVEVIVVDDGSTDHTESIVRQYVDRARYVRIRRCGRSGAVRNHGLRQATGNYIAFLDADDFWLSSSLARRLAVLRERPSVGFVHGNYYTLDGGERRLQFDGTLPPSGHVFVQLFRYNFIHTSSVLARRELVDRSEGFHAHVHSAEDYWLWLHLASHAEVAFVVEPVSVYRIRPGSLSRRALTAKLPDLMRIVTQAAGRFDVPSRLFHERINPLRLWLAKEHARRRHYLAAARYLLPTMWSEPMPTLRSGLRSLRSRSFRSAP